MDKVEDKYRYKSGPNHTPPKLKLGALRLAWLESYVAVARLKNRSHAAKELGLTQAAVTKHIQSLEDWSRMVLVWPGSSPVMFTEQGEAFVEVAEQVLDTLSKARPILIGPQVEPSKPHAKSWIQKYVNVVLKPPKT